MGKRHYLKNGADGWREGLAIPNSELTYVPYTPCSYAYCTDTSLRYKDLSLLVKEAQEIFPDTEEAVMGKRYVL